MNESNLNEHVGTKVLIAFEVVFQVVLLEVLFILIILVFLSPLFIYLL